MAPAHITRAQARLAARLLVDECTVTRPVLGTINTASLRIDDDTVDVWSGACFVNARPGNGDEWVSVESLGQVDARVRVRLPVSCPALAVGDLITVTASEHPELVGVVLEVLDDRVSTFTVSKVIVARWRKRS